uniref:Uncharacterized protein n=1 Tax=Oryza sativa subsp. japonica TaxID=39947 RepID=Q2QRY7_ORYSJ|nr:hypothetical protein LOC_Os12g25950 [Oryza sativa Japonica Group]
MRATGRGAAATGRHGRRLKRENGRRGFHFIAEGNERATGEAWNGGGNGARRPWKVARNGAGVPGNGGCHSRGKLGEIKEDGRGINSPQSILESNA